MFGATTPPSFIDQLKQQSKQELERALQDLYHLSQNNQVDEMVTLLQMTQKAIMQDEPLSRHRAPEDGMSERALIQEKVRNLSERSPVLLRKVLDVRAKLARRMNRNRNNPHEEKYRDVMHGIEESAKRTKEKLRELKRQGPPQ